MKRLAAITLSVVYWSVSVVAALIFSAWITSKLEASVAICVLLCWVALTIIRVRQKMKTVTTLLAIAAIAFYETLVALLLRHPLGYGGQAAGLFFLLPLLLGLVGFSMDVTTVGFAHEKTKKA